MTVSGLRDNKRERYYMSDVMLVQLRDEEARTDTRSHLDTSAGGKQWPFLHKDLYFTLNAEHNVTSGKYQRWGRKQMPLKRAELNCSQLWAGQSLLTRQRHPQQGEASITSRPHSKERTQLLRVWTEEGERTDLRALGERSQHILESQWMKEMKMWRFLVDGEMVSIHPDQKCWCRGRFVRRMGDEFNSGQMDIQSVFIGSKEDRQFYSQEDLWLELNTDI